MLEGLGEEAAVRVEEGAALLAVFRDQGEEHREDARVDGSYGWRGTGAHFGHRELGAFGGCRWFVGVVGGIVILNYR